MKKLIINEDWQGEEIAVNDTIFVVALEDFTNNLYWIWDSSTDEAVARDSFEAAINGLKEINYDYCKVSLVKLPNTSQVKDLIELIGTMPQSNKDLMGELLGRVDCEVLDVYNTKLEEAKKRKKKVKGSLPFSSITYTTGDPAYNIKMFNKLNGTDFEDQIKDATKEAEKETAPVIDATVDAGASSGEGTLVGETNTASEGSAGEASSGGESAGEGAGGLGESMDIKEETIITEDNLYAHVNMSTLNLPDEIKLLSQKDVEAFVKELEPGQLFEIGYITPISTYAQLDDNFRVLKATVFTGYTGIDYRDVSVGSEEEKAARLAKAKQDIINNPDGAHGWTLNPDGFSADYRGQTNKLAHNVEKKSDYGWIEGKKIDMNRILFYPETGSKPKAAYYVGYRAIKTVENGKKVQDNYFEWTRVDHKDVYKTFMDRFNDFIIQDSKAYTPDEADWVQKKLGLTMPEFILKYPTVSVNNYKIATKFGIDPIEYVKKYPYTRKWDMEDLARKLSNAHYSQNSIGNLANKKSHEITNGKGLDIEHSWDTDKPAVRALYTNQVFYLSTKGETLGNRSVVENLKEEVLGEAKRYVKRYYIRPQNVFASNKEEILKALVAAGDQNCSVYSLKNLDDHDDVHLLKPSDIIYYYDDHVLYDKNHVQVMDYDLFVKHEEERKKVADVDAISDSTFGDIYDDRLTDADLKDKEIKVSAPTHESLDSFNPFTLDFEDINAYGEKLTEGKDDKFICCICGEESIGYGNNPAPVKDEGRCCDACNRKFVIPARIEELNLKDKQEENK